jgi:Holliday junction resolvase-like predicted endonuclease
MPGVMICLVGEQPVSNLLPVLHVLPKRTLLICSQRTKRVGDNLEGTLKLRGLSAEIKCLTDAYDIVRAQEELEPLFADLDSELRTNAVFNVTGGTKPMSFAALRLAQNYNASLVYLQSEKAKSLIYKYRFNGDEIILEGLSEIGEVIELADYLNAHGLTGWNIKRGANEFERVVLEALKDHVSEILSNVCIGALEIDLVIRSANQVGVAEIKTGKGALKKEGIDQLSTATAREYLGTYTKRFLIVDRELGSNNLALARARYINVIHVRDDWKNGLSACDGTELVKVVTETLGASR